MIVSHEHRFIFIKTRKTASTSIELALSKICGERDIITPCKQKDEIIRTEIGGRAPQHYMERFLRYSFRDWFLLLRDGERKRRFCNHIRAEWVRERVGKTIWDSYFKFCFERNPWDKVVSAFFWRRSHDPSAKDQYPLLDDFIFSGAAKRRYSDFPKCCVGGKVAMDFVGRYECIERDWHQVMRTLGLPEDIKLPHAKSGLRPNQNPYQAILTEAQRDRIAADFAREIRYFGYSF
ncbi:MAG TPA: sulfotransferase family 2 domain-containing protein [Verrucomicrobiae bacterium]|nr:sulfotransferase family 2 domain-containing protein [Verrucomicrobiae bacterium]